MWSTKNDYLEKRKTLHIAEDNLDIGTKEPKFESIEHAHNCKTDNCFNAFSLFKKGVLCKACGKVSRINQYDIFGDKNTKT